MDARPESGGQTFWHKAAAIDPRILYTIIFIFTAIVVLNPPGLPVEIGRLAQEHYDYIESMPEGSILWLDAAYSEGASGELNPMLRADMIHAYRNGHRIVLHSMWLVGSRMAAMVLEDVMEFLPDMEYGVDIVHLGWRPGGASVILRSATRDIYETYDGVDHFANPLDDFPLMQEVPRLHPDYIDYAMIYETGSPGGADFLQYVTEPSGLPMGIGLVAVSVPGRMPFLDSGQYQTMIAGSTGCAQYELLIGEPGMALAAQDVLSIGMLYVTLLIIIGNIAWFASRDS